MFRTILIAGLVLASCLFAGGGPVIQPLSDSEKAVFYQVLENEVYNARNLAAQIAKASESASHDPGKFSIHFAELQEATTMAIVKEELLAGLKGTPSMDSPIVRSELTKLLKQESISISELSDFDNLIKMIKKQMGSDKN